MMRNTRLLPAALVASLLIAAPGLADNGYRLEYDYPDQRDLWDGGYGFPDPRLDYPPIELDLAWNGDDYGIGYERMLDPLGFGPAEQLTQQRHSAYAFRFGNQAFFGYECWFDDDCGAGSWCRSAPTCRSNHCLEGTPRNCSDGNDCTDDTCDPFLEQCLHDWVQPPGDVTGLVLSRAPASTIATLSWDDRPDEEWFNVYRGEGPGLGDLACYIPGVSGTTADDDGSIAVSNLYVHLVTADHHCGEGRLGVDSDLNLRFNHAPCP